MHLPASAANPSFPTSSKIDGFIRGSDGQAGLARREVTRVQVGGALDERGASVGGGGEAPGMQFN